MLTCNRLEAGGSKLEAWLTVADFFLSFEPQASCLKLISALANGLMLVFQHPVKDCGFSFTLPGNVNGLER
jgi:hypothetical protein